MSANHVRSTIAAPPCMHVYSSPNHSHAEPAYLHTVNTYFLNKPTTYTPIYLLKQHPVYPTAYQWRADTFGYPGSTPINLLDRTPHVLIYSCLSIKSFRLHAHFHIAIQWLPGPPHLHFPINLPICELLLPTYLTTYLPNYSSARMCICLNVSTREILYLLRLCQSVCLLVYLSLCQSVPSPFLHLLTAFCKQ